MRSSHHTLIVTAQDHGSSLMLRQGETLRVVLVPAQAAD